MSFLTELKRRNVIRMAGLHLDGLRASDWFSWLEQTGE